MKFEELTPEIIEKEKEIGREQARNEGKPENILDKIAEVEEKKYLIEIGDIADKRKNALMQFYAEQNSNIEFIHEGYGEKIIINEE